MNMKYLVMVPQRMYPNHVNVGAHDLNSLPT